jgi:DNA-binding transcriptional ArsR family regulator
VTERPCPVDPTGGLSYIPQWLYVVAGGAVKPRSDKLLDRIADRLKAMADPMRLRILHVLHDGEQCVTDILERVGGSQANVSKHLSVLRRAGLVECRREGVNVIYHIEDPAVFAICSTICDSLERQLDAERDELTRGRAAMQVAEP